VQETVVIRETLRTLQSTIKVCNFLKMVVHRRRYLKIRAEIRRLEAENQARTEATREHECLPMDITYRSLPADTSTYRRRQITKKEAVLMIEKAWIRKR
jgi:hypothetical protein